MKSKKYFLFLILACMQVFAQKSNKIVIENADFSDINQDEVPDALLLRGNVRVRHDGVIMTCNKAYYYQVENYIKAFGDVQMVQGDTLYLNSKYAEYSGNVKKAFASGNVIMTSPESTMSTDTIHFDRNTQEAYFNSNGTIVNKDNTLKSRAGRYYLKEKKYQFLSAVELKNPDYTIKTNHLDYKTTHGDSDLKGPSTIVGKETFIYTENGYYNSKTNTGHFLQKSYIKYKDRLIEGDSLYYDRKIEYASGTNNVKITDSINKAIIKGHYGEVFKQKDSVYITKHASIRYKVENDSMFIHAKKIFLTGKVGERIIKGQKNVRFFKTDLSGKCDSIHSDQKRAFTQLIGKPILWNFESQLTGDVMHLISNNKTEQLDSLKVLNNAFIISKDTIGTGFNQVKGQNLYGKFLDDKLKEVDIVKNAEVIYYLRNDEQELIGINKSTCSNINMILDGNTIETITNFNQIEGEIYPEKELPENTRKLRGFVWRGDERIKTKEDIFPEDEVEMDKKIIEESRNKYEKEKLVQEIEKAELEDHLNGDDFYEEIFKKYNNFIIRDDKGVLYLVRNFKFRFPTNENSVGLYIKNHPNYKKIIDVKNFNLNSESDFGKKYYAGFFKGDEEIGEIEFTENKVYTNEEIFEKFNFRQIIDKSGNEMLIRNKKVFFPKDDSSWKKVIKKYPKYKKQVRINQYIWNWNDQDLLRKYNGGFFTGDEQE